MAVTILSEILKRKEIEIIERKRKIPQEKLRDKLNSVSRPRGFKNAIIKAPSPAVIAEIKRRSPSKGEIRKNFDPTQCAEMYARGGAAALSVLTDEFYFGGHLDYLKQIRQCVPIPLLRKDFMIDTYQIDEAIIHGADAILLIVAALSEEILLSLYSYAKSVNLDVLVEVHDVSELDRAIGIGSELIGVNNRNLKTFVTDISVTEKLAAKVPPNCTLISESGIGENAEMLRLSNFGVKGFLVGESLMRQPDLAYALKRLRGDT